MSKKTGKVASQRVGEQAVWKAQGKDVNEYNFLNEVTEKKREALLPFIKNGTLSYEEAVDFARNAGKTYYYDDDEGGHSSTYYNKKQMIEYLVANGVPHDKAAALYNSFKSAKTNPYSGNDLSSGRRGYGRRRYGRRYHRRGGGGSSKAKVPALKQSAFKAETFKPKASTPSPRSTNANRVSTKVNVKIEPPKVKFKEYEV